MLNIFRRYQLKVADNKIKTFLFPRVRGGLRLGEFSLASDDAEVRCFKGPKRVTVGKYCSIGKCTFMVDANHQTHFASTFPFNELWFSKAAPANELRKATPVIGSDVWLCDESFIHSGVVVHDGAIVAGNAVVTKDVPPYAIVGGNPARVIRYRFDEDIIRRFLRVKWWDLPPSIVVNDLIPYLADPVKFLEMAERYRREVETEE